MYVHRCEPDAFLLFMVIVVFHLGRDDRVVREGERVRRTKEATEKGESFRQRGEAREAAAHTWSQLN